jgi:ferredoxin-type protein NapG
MSLTWKELLRPAALTPRQRKERRGLLLSLATGAGVVALALAGYVPVVKGWAKRLRPPGALDEREFLASCIKCGQCVQVCPVKAIKLADAADGFGNGVPFIDARAQACDFSCDAVQCVLACPTGALTHTLDKKEQTRMGLAKLARPDACLARMGKGFKGPARGAAYDGLHRYIKVDRWKPIRVADHPYDLELCDLCVRECPIKDALALEPMSSDPNDKRRTPVVKQACVGCGMCEMICPAEPAAIVIEERLKWENKAKGVGA